MKITKPRGEERRVIVTLARHERSTMATIIINKLKKSKQYGEFARENGATVYYEAQPGRKELLYFIRPEQLTGVNVAATFINQVKVNR